MASGGGDEPKSSWWGWDNIIKVAKEKVRTLLTQLVKTMIK